MSKTLESPKHPREMTHLFHPEVVKHLKSLKDTEPKPPLKKE